MRVAVVYNRPVTEGNESAACSADVLDQVEAVSRALLGLGHEPVAFPLTRSGAVGLPAALKSAGVACAVNLCESLDEDPRLQGHVAVLLELAQVPYTGSDMLALQLTTDKCLAKKALQAAGLPTPRFALCGLGEVPTGLTFPVILKPRHEDGSVGIEQDSVVSDRAGLESALSRMQERYGEVLAEEYVAGREINVALLGHPEARALPVAEIDFSGLPPGLWPIVGYRAKWAPESPEYLATPRRFPEDAAALSCAPVAERAFRLFGCRDYGRVDIRLAPDGTPHVLEVNANPCLSPGAGFEAALSQAGLGFEGFVERLIEFALSRGGA